MKTRAASSRLISAFAADSLRQHDLVQVQRVLLSPVARTPLSQGGWSAETRPVSRAGQGARGFDTGQRP